MKRCSTCKQSKDSICFDKRKSATDGLNPVCRECRREYRAKFYAANADRLRKSSRDWAASRNKSEVRDQNLRRTFGISLAQYEEKLKGQDGVCAICKKPESSLHNRSKQVKPLAVDHDHRTGKVRGLLCNACNIALGALKDDFETVLAASKYLHAHQGIV